MATGVALIVTAVLVVRNKPSNSANDVALQNNVDIKSADQNNTAKTIGTAEKNQFSQQYSQGKCNGTETVPFTQSPMKIADIGIIEPYGIMVDAHVIPTSHGYISPINFRSERDAYPVYAIADGTIVNVSHRGEFVGEAGGNHNPTDEYQLYFEYSCAFYSYYDLLTSLAPDIAKEVGELKGFDSKLVRIPIKAGQEIGRVGGQTVDFAVWNFNNPPAHFSNPKSYEGDENRFYLDDMFSHFTDEIKSALLSKVARLTEPKTGKVDYDVDGKLVGVWFKEGSGGFRGPKEAQNKGGRYWDGHLAIVYDFLDPTHIILSIGDFAGTAKQFGVKGNAPDPAAITVDSGLIKYELQQSQYVDSVTKLGVDLSKGLNPHLIAKNSDQVMGTVLIQMVEPMKLKLETFPNKTAALVAGFTENARTYVR